MKTVLAFATLVCMSAGSAFAADNQVADQTLAKMGLGSMQSMSDNDGLAVRGKGTSAHVWGSSTANWYGGQTANNNYEAGASWLGASSNAVGKSFSFAGKLQISGAADPTLIRRPPSSATGSR